MIMAYPFMKRITQYPQAFLAVALNIGAFMGFGAVTDYISWPICSAVYMAGIANTICYDSILAFQDIEADRKIGVYSTSQKFLKHAKAFSGTLGAISVSLHALAGYLAGLHPIFLPVLGMGAAHLAWQSWKLDPTKPAMCDHLFNVSYRYGLFVLAAYMLGVYFAKGKRKQVEAEIDKRKASRKQQELEELKDDLPTATPKFQ